MGKSGVPADQLWKALFNLSMAVANRGHAGIRHALDATADLAARSGREAEAARVRQLAQKFAEPVLVGPARDYLSQVDSRRSLGSLILSGEAREQIARFLDVRRGADLLRARGLGVPNRVLLLGPPGCGKTSLASALAEELSIPLFKLATHAVIGSLLGETANRVVKVFENLPGIPCAVLIDEADSLFWRRSEGGSAESEMRRTVNALLPMLDGIPDNVVLVAASNTSPRLLDAAVLRRFHLRLEMPANVTEQSLRGMAKNLGAEHGLDLKELPGDFVRDCLEACASLAHAEVVLRDALQTLVLSLVSPEVALREAARRLTGSRSGRGDSSPEGS